MTVHIESGMSAQITACMVSLCNYPSSKGLKSKNCYRRVSLLKRFWTFKNINLVCIRPSFPLFLFSGTIKFSKNVYLIPFDINFAWSVLNFLFGFIYFSWLRRTTVPRDSLFSILCLIILMFDKCVMLGCNVVPLENKAAGHRMVLHCYKNTLFYVIYWDM